MTKPAPGEGWQKRQRSELRKLIFETALDLFRTKGVESTTVQQIASAVGIGKGTFFNHFPSKDHVLQEWYRQITRLALQKSSKNSNRSGRDSVLALAVDLARYASRDPALWDAKVNAASNPLLREEENDLNQEVFEFCRGAIQNDLSGLKRKPEVSAGFLTGLVIAVITGDAHTWSISGHTRKLEKTIEEHIKFVLDAALLKKDEA